MEKEINPVRNIDSEGGKKISNGVKPGRLFKLRMVDEYTDRLKDSSSIFVTDFRGLTDKEFKDLRKKLKLASAHYLIVKNSICRLALKKLKLSNLADMITGSCALSYGQDDPVSISKTLVSFHKDNKNLKLKGGYADGQVMTEDMIKELAALPSREVLLAKLVSCLNSPVVGLVSVCSGIVKKLLYALNEIVKQKKTND